MSDPGQSDYQKFTLSDDVPPEALADRDRPEAGQDHRIRRLNQRLTLQAVLIPCFVIVALLAAFFHFKEREDTFRETLLAETLQAFQQLETELDGLATRYDKLGARLDEKFPSINQTAASLRTDFEKTRQSLQSLKNDLKVDQKKRARSMKAVEKKVKAFGKTLKQIEDRSNTGDQQLEQAVAQIKTTVSEGIGASIDELNADLNAGIDELNQRMADIRKGVSKHESDLKRINAGLERVNSGLARKMSRGRLDAALESQQNTFRQELNTL